MTCQSDKDATCMITASKYVHWAWGYCDCDELPSSRTEKSLRNFQRCLKRAIITLYYDKLLCIVVSPWLSLCSCNWNFTTAPSLLAAGAVHWPAVARKFLSLGTRAWASCCWLQVSIQQPELGLCQLWALQDFGPVLTRHWQVPYLDCQSHIAWPLAKNYWLG